MAKLSARGNHIIWRMQRTLKEHAVERAVDHVALRSDGVLLLRLVMWYRDHFSTTVRRIDHGWKISQRGIKPELHAALKTSLQVLGYRETLGGL